MPSNATPRNNAPRSATIDVVGLQGSQRIAQQVRPSSAGASTSPTLGDLPFIGEEDSPWVHSYADSSGVMDTPIILLVRSLTPESIAASSLPKSLVYPQATQRTRSLDVAPSEDSGYSISSGPPTPSAHNEIQTSSHEPIIVYEPDGAVKAATIQGLVKRLLIDSKDFSKDLEFKQTFLTSYRAFSNAEEVFRLLREQFEAVSAPEHTGEQRASVRYSVLTVLEMWVRENHVEAKDINLLDQMRDFIIDLQTTSLVTPFRGAAQRIAQMISDKRDMFLSSAPPLTPSSSPGTRSHINPVNITPEDLALVLTLIERDRYQKIISPDCIGWLEGFHDLNGASSFIAENTKLAYWVQKSILKLHDQLQRSQNFEYFLCVIEECRRLRNFSSACALIGGLAASCITSLKRTFDLNTASMEKFDGARKLISFERNFKTYRAALNSSPTKPCIPWLYVHLHDLKIIHRAYPPFIEQGEHTGLINFYRYYRVRHRIHHILSYQDPPFEPSNISHHHAEIQTFVEDQLRSFVVDDALRKWLEERGSTVAHEEQVNYDARADELVAAGFIPPTVSHRPRTPHPSTSNPRQITNHSHDPLPMAPSVVNPPPPLTPLSPGPETANDSSTDPLDKNSEHCLDGKITRLGQFSAACGGFADVWEGFIGTQKVAIKTLRPFAGSGRWYDDGKLLKRFRREYEAWVSVSHPNVLPCLGFSYDFSREPHILPSLVSPWMLNGTVFPYLEKHPDANRLKLLSGIARGLSYLHDRQIIHGDLRAGNVLMSDSGVPCLSDFGLSRSIQVEEMTTTSDLAGSLRWMSPELLSVNVAVTSSSDVWAFGMTVLEIMSGRHPYYEEKTDVFVLNQLKDGEIPKRPRDVTILTNRVWAICQQCWIIEPQDRYSMSAVLDKLESIT